MPSSESREEASGAPKLGTGRIVALLIVGTLAFLVLALIAPWAWQQLHPAPAGMATAASGLPWQIERLPEGGTRVFGLRPGQDRLGRIADLHPDNSLKLALVKDEQGRLTLEGYVETLKAGFVQGKLVVTGAADPGTLQRWADHNTAREPQPSGAWRLSLDAQDEAEALQSMMTGMVFLPAARFDEATAVERFGPPAERRVTADGTVHLLYPDRGLVVALDPQGRGKPVLQYVAPADFSRLSAPLGR